MFSTETYDLNRFVVEVSRRATLNAGARPVGRVAHQDLVGATCPS